MDRRIKGAISVFMVIVYIWVFILMGVLVDGARIRMAEAQAEEIQQIANETMLTYYNRALYEYYDLFGESKISADAMGSMIQEIMQQSMSLELNGDLKEVMDSKWVFSLSGRSYFDPYDLTVDSISVGSNINLLDKDVFISQVNDAMKYSGPLVLVNNFLNLIDSFGAASEGMAAVSECTDAVSDLSEKIEAYQDQIEKLRYMLYNFCEEPAGFLNSAERTSAEAFEPIEYAEAFDEAVERKLASLRTKIQEMQKEENEGKDVAAKKNEINGEIINIFNTYYQKMGKIKANGEELDERISEAIRAGESLKGEITGKQSELNTKGMSQSNTDVGEIYSGFSDSLGSAQESIDGYTRTLVEIRSYVQNVHKGSGNSLSWEEFKTSALDICEQLKENYDPETTKMAEDIIVSQFSWMQNTQLKDILSALDGLKRVEIDDTQLKEAEESVKNGQKSSAAPESTEDMIDDTDRLGKVITISETSSEDTVETTLDSKYDRKNAKEQSKEVSGSITSLMGTLLGNAAEALMDNLYSDAYILTNFRNYVHTYKMLNEDGSNNSGKDGYDTVANIKFLEGEKNLLTREQFQKIETTCAEAEYVLYGMQDTKACVAAAYATIYGYRLALDYVSVFLTSDFRKIVMNSAEAAGIYAPLVIALLPFAWAIPRAASDMIMIMQGKCTPLIFTDEDDWIETDYADSDQYLAGYSDYLLIMLLMMNEDKKIERMQDIIQMNMRTIDSNFTLEKALVNVYAQSTCSVKYLFMTQAFMPASTRMDGRYSFEVKTSVSY